MASFPEIARIKQMFPRPRTEGLEEALKESFESFEQELTLTAKRIAVAVGSRGIAQLGRIVRATVQMLSEAGAEPFVVPAMGSHGGATAEGQVDILRKYGVNEDTMGVPIKSSLDTVHIGDTASGIPVRLDRAAMDSDGIVVINRIKPHTDFQGVVESGLLKMISVGLGNEEGARDFHSAVRGLSYDKVILEKASLSLQTGRFLFGVAIIENAYHEVADLVAVRAEEFLEREPSLLDRARELMPSLPVEQADLLIIDQIGKNISGTGMDPNITGRRFQGHSVWQDHPEISRIAILDLTEESDGNVIGLGLADFCSRRVVDKMDRDITYRNVLTSQNPAAARLPIYFDTDREVVIQAVASLGTSTRLSSVRLIRIKDTLSLGTLDISEALLDTINRKETIAEVSRRGELSFDHEGNLYPMDLTQ